MEIEKVKRTLLPAIRQYRHNAVPINDQDKFVCGYDYDETNKIMADSLANPIDAMVMQKIAEITEKYLEKYGCNSCWSDSHNCTCRNDKFIIKKFSSHLVSELSNFCITNKA